MKPSDLFHYIEEQHRVPDFRFQRIQAERKARLDAPHRPDVTYTAIYEYLHVDPEIELETESRALYPREDIMDVYRRAQKQGKKIAILSDMYLPKSFVASQLERAGVRYDYLFVSGDDGVIKGDGSMFRELIRVSNTAPNKILHIGDNERSDFERPRSMGLRAVHISNEWPFFDDRRFGASLVTRLAAASWRGSQIAAIVRDYCHAHPAGNVWASIGSLISGPLALSFANWIGSQADKDGIDRIRFLARDGWLPRYALQKLRPDLQTSYCYANRAIVCRALFDKPTETLLSQVDKLLPMPLEKLLEQFGFDVAAIAADVADRFDLEAPAADRRDLYARLTRLGDASKAFRNEVAEARRLLEAHLRQAGAFTSPDRFALCDVGWSGNVSDMLASLFPEAIEWRYYFFGTRADFKNRELRVRSFFFHLGLPDHHHDLAFECVEIPETLLTSPEESALKLSEIKGVVSPPTVASNTIKAEISENRARLVKGAEIFIDFALRYAPTVSFEMDRHVVFALLEHITRSQEPDLLEAFRNFKHQVHAGDAEWRPVGPKKARYAATIVRWLKGRRMRRMGPIASIERQERAYLDSLSGLRKFIAKRAYRIALSKRKRLRRLL